MQISAVFAIAATLIPCSLAAPATPAKPAPSTPAAVFPQLCKVEMFDNNARFVGMARGNWDKDFVIKGHTIKCNTRCETKDVVLPKNWSVKGYMIKV
ncbi:hypothetical protein PspLS_11270 [Pyricularia sp. CBS 133598]|nr:hypothetical protein PspLS_11270 [Pyricularia sp. CBS 133598]